MKRAGFGRIVLVASPSANGSTHAASTTARHALVGVTRRVSADVGPFGITVNAILPGEIDETMDGSGGERDGSNAPRRFGRPLDVANAAIFLASPEAAWINGQVLPVDGGHG